MCLVAAVAGKLPAAIATVVVQQEAVAAATVLEAVVAVRVPEVVDQATVVAEAEEGIEDLRDIN